MFSQVKLNSLVSDWIIIKYLPFSFFDDESTQNIFKYLQSEAVIPKRGQLKSLIFDRFKETQAIVLQILQSNNSKISFTLDGWTSINGRSYYGITGHFISNEWILHSLVVDFVESNGEHTGKAIAKLFFGVLEKYNLLDKLQGITLDNAAANTKFVTELSILLNNRFTGLSFNPLDLHFRCFAHIIHLAAQDFIKNLQIDDNGVNDDDDEVEEELEFVDSEAGEEMEGFEKTENTNFETANDKVIVKLRTIFKKIKYSEQLKKKLESCCSTLEIEMSAPIVDVSTRWNSTNDMIESGLKMQKALDLLCLTNPKLKIYALKKSDWELLTLVVKHLKNFKILSKILCGDKYITIPLVVVGFNIILDKLQSSIEKLHQNKNKTNIECQLYNALTSAYAKLMKHYQKTNWSYCAVLLLDPRHKLKSFKKTEWGKEMEVGAFNKFEEIYKEYYENRNLESVDNQENLRQNNDQNLFDDDDSSDTDSLIDINAFYGSAISSPWREEICRYVEAPCADAATDIAQWWKQHMDIYPTLSKMARDYFSIQATSVPAERLFSKAGLTIRKHRNRLNSESARVCMCLNSWLTCSLADCISNLLSENEKTSK